MSSISRLKSILNFIFLLFCFTLSYGQQNDASKLLSLREQDSASLLLDKRPNHAFYLSLLLPGAGQIYNHRWWKLPIVYGAYGLAVYNLKYSRDLYKKWNGFYQEAIVNGTVLVAPDRNYTVTQTKYVRDKVRDNKDLALFAVIGVHLLASLEAYVDAHLKNFNIDEELSFKLSPQSGGLALVYTLH